MSRQPGIEYYMKYIFSPDRTTLTITIDAEEVAVLNKAQAEDPERFQSDAALHDFFERLTCNSDLEWLTESQIAAVGDLTSAPMLGILDGEKVLERWAFMNYQVVSPLETLRVIERVTFEGGAVN